MFLFNIFLSLLSGAFVKISDFLDDKLHSKNPFRYVFPLVYGILIGYLISHASFSMIFLGAVLAQIFARKVDTKTHVFGYLVILFSLLYFGFPEIDFYFLFFFFLFALLDEMDRIIFWDKPEWVVEFRPFLELAALPFAFMGRWDFLAAILIFDLSYIFTASLLKNYFFSVHRKRWGER